MKKKIKRFAISENCAFAIEMLKAINGNHEYIFSQAQLSNIQLIAEKAELELQAQNITLPDEIMSELKKQLCKICVIEVLNEIDGASTKQAIDEIGDIVCKLIDIDIPSGYIDLLVGKIEAGELKVINAEKNLVCQLSFDARCKYILRQNKLLTEFAQHIQNLITLDRQAHAFDACNVVELVPLYLKFSKSVNVDLEDDAFDVEVSICSDRAERALDCLLKQMKIQYRLHMNLHAEDQAAFFKCTYAEAWELLKLYIAAIENEVPLNDIKRISDVGAQLLLICLQKAEAVLCSSHVYNTTNFLARKNSIDHQQLGWSMLEITKKLAAVGSYVDKNGRERKIFYNFICDLTSYCCNLSLLLGGDKVEKLSVFNNLFAVEHLHVLINNHQKIMACFNCLMEHNLVNLKELKNFIAALDLVLLQLLRRVILSGSFIKMSNEAYAFLLQNVLSLQNTFNGSNLRKLFGIITMLEKERFEHVVLQKENNLDAIVACIYKQKTLEYFSYVTYKERGSNIDHESMMPAQSMVLVDGYLIDGRKVQAVNATEKYMQAVLVDLSAKLRVF